MNELVDFRPDMGQKLVYLAPNNKEPFTTSDVIARYAGMNHRRVKDAIRKHEKELKSFGLLGAYQTESSGGRPQEIYRLNEPQATFLMTLLKNTPEVVAFKMLLVQQFYAMRRELEKCNNIKVNALRPSRRKMTDAIDELPDSPHKKFKYPQFTNLVYLMAIGKTAKAIRAERGAKPTDTASDFLTSDELLLVEDFTNRVGVMIDAGLDYKTIKSALQKRLTAKEAS